MAKRKGYELEIKIAGAVAKSLGTSVSKVEEHFEQIKKAGKITGVAIGSALAAAETATIALGTMATKSAVSFDKATGDLAAGTDLSTEKLAEYENVLKNVYTNNYGESFEDIADKMKLTTEQMGELSEIDMQKAVENGYLLQDVFDIDYAEGLRGADAMMTQFGIDAETAYNLMAQGAKNGLNQNGDLADQLAEYSGYYAQLGFSAEEMMNMVASGAADGVYQIDYLNDAMKEFGIRSIDGSKATTEAYKALGLNSKKMMSDFAKGGETSKAAFQKVTTALSNINNDVKRNEIGVALFGTKWEDLGESAVMAMTNASGAIDASIDALSGMEAVKYADLESMFQGFTRSIEVALLPLGEALIPILGDLMGQLSPVITDLFAAIDFSMISDLAGVLLPVLSELAKTLLPVISEMLSTLAPTISEVLIGLLPVISTLLPILAELITGLLPAILPLIDPILQIVMALMPLIESLAPLIVSVASILSDCIRVILEILTPVIDVISSLLASIINIANVVLQVGQVIVGAISRVISGVAQIISNIIGLIMAAITGCIDWLTEKFSVFVNFVIGCINWLIERINSISIGPLPDWDILGKYAGAEIGFNIPLIPEVALAEGGIAMGPVNALVGEGGEPEVVAPLSKLPTLLADEEPADKGKPVNGGGGGNTYYITFAPNIYCDGSNRDEIEDIFDDEYEKFKAFMDKYVHDNDRVKF